MFTTAIPLLVARTFDLLHCFASTGPPIYNATKFSGGVEVDFDGKRIRKTMVRKTVDYNTSVIKYLEVRSLFIVNTQCLDFQTSKRELLPVNGHFVRGMSASFNHNIFGLYVIKVYGGNAVLNKL